MAENKLNHISIVDITNATRKLGISRIDTAYFNQLINQSKKNSNIQIFSITLQNINIILASKKQVDLAIKLPAKYYKYLDIFCKSDLDILPKYRPGYDHTVELVEGKTPMWDRLYFMSANKLKILKAYIKKMVDKGIIPASFSSGILLVLFAKKPGRSLRFCMDYSPLNTITKKNYYPLSLIKKILKYVCKAKIFSNIDIISAFNKLCIKEGDKWKIAFCKKYSLYKYLVMFFGLANNPSFFQTYINNVLHGILNIFCIAYIDDILIYSNSKKDYWEHVYKVLEMLQKAGL